MDLRLSDEQEALRKALTALFDNAGGCDRARQAAGGADAELWSALCEVTSPGLSLPRSSDGADALFADLAVVAEEVGRCIAPVPFVEASVAARAIDRTTDSIDPAIVSGASVATIALHPARAGRWAAVPAAATADYAVGLDGDDWILLELPAGRAHIPNLGDLPVAHVGVDSGRRTVLASGEDAHREFVRARAEWRALGASYLVGVAAGALAIGVNYVQQRTAFGVSLATFQSIAHGLADGHTTVEGARLISQEAAWAIDGGRDDAARLSTMAYFFAAETAERVAGQSLHFHGGYGFMLEYDVQLYYRRAKAWSLLCGDRQGLLEDIADDIHPPARG